MTNHLVHPSAYLRCGLLAACAIAAALASAAVEAPAASRAAPGDTFVYRIIDGYNSEPRGQLSVRVEASDAARTTLSIGRAHV